MTPENTFFEFTNEAEETTEGKEVIFMNIIILDMKKAPSRWK